MSLLTVAGAGAAVWAGMTLLQREFPDVSRLKTEFPVVIYKGPKHPFEVKLQKGRPSGWVGLSQISRAAVGAVVVSEDWAFYQHKGYDPAQIRDAIEEDLREGKMRGASTITQQVVKNVFLSQERSLWRKFKELILAIRIEEAVKKPRILEAYLNVAEWGEGVFGISAASRHYFGKAPSELTPREGAFLAMLLPSPKRYSQSFRQKQLTRYAHQTVDAILGKMTQARYITVEERERERLARLPFEAVAPGAGKDPEGHEEDADPAENSSADGPTPAADIAPTESRQDPKE